MSFTSKDNKHTFGYESTHAPVLGVEADPVPGGAKGERYLIGAAPAAPWGGNEGKIAQHNGTDWDYIIPEVGDRVYSVADSKDYLCTSTDPSFVWETAASYTEAEVDALLDAKASTTHAASHLAAGSDPIAVMQPPGGGVDGVSGLVPQPVLGDGAKFLKGDGTWDEPAGGGGGGGEDLEATLTIGNTTGGVHIEGQTQIVLEEAAGPAGVGLSGAIFVSNGIAAGQDANHLYYQPTVGDAISLSIHAEIGVVSDFIFRPDEPSPGQNVYSDFDTLYAALVASPATKKRIVLDNSITSPVPIPNLEYDLSGVMITASRENVAELDPPWDDFAILGVSISWGVDTILKNVSRVQNLSCFVLDVSQAGTPFQFDEGMNVSLENCMFHTFYDDPIIKVASAAGTSVAFHLWNTTLSIGEDGAGGHKPPLELDDSAHGNGETVSFILNGKSRVGANALRGDADNEVSSISLSAESRFSPLQGSPPWTGEPIPSFTSAASNVSVDVSSVTTVGETIPGTDTADVQSAFEGLDTAIDGHIDGSYLHSEIDVHMDEATVHFTEGSIDHDSITGSGTLTHGEIDTHVGATDNPHGTDIENLGSGTLAELNAAITDANIDDEGSARTPTAHASEHLTGGLDEIGVFEGPAAPANGTEGLVPPPLVADAEKFLKGDGSWDDVPPGADGTAPIARSFLVEFNGADFEIDEVPNADIELLRGFTYEFIDALLDEGPDHPFIISTSLEGAALAPSLPSDPEDYDYYEDGNNIIFRPSHDAAITSYYYHCDDHAGEGGTILLSTLGEHDEGGGSIINPYVFTQGGTGTPYVIATDSYHIGVETDDGLLLMRLPHPDDVEVGMTYIISDIDGNANPNNIDIEVAAIGGGGPATIGKFMGGDGVQIDTDWGYVQVVNVQRTGDNRTWVIVSSFGTVLI
jgi:hypothetical protein